MPTFDHDVKTDASKTREELIAELETLRQRLSNLEWTEGRESKESADQLAIKQGNIYKDAPVGLCYLDRNLRYVFINERLAAINGLPMEDHLGRTIGEVLPGVAAAVESQLCHVIDTGEPIIRGTVYAETPNRPGWKRTFQYSYLPVKSGDGTVLGVSCVVDEITERRRSEEALQESQRHIGLLIKSVPALISYIDQEKRFQFTNEAYEQVFGLSTNQIHGCPVGDILGDSAFRIAEPNLDRALSGQRVEFENVIRNKEGNKRHIDVSYLPDVDEAGAVKGLFTLAYDVTERKKMEEALRQSEARLRAILEVAVDGMITIDQHGIIESFNHSAERIFGYEADEVVGRNVKLLMPASDSGRHDDYLAAYLGTGKAKIIGIGREVKGRRKDGAILDLHLSVGEIYHGEHRSFVGTLHDLTESKRLQEQLRQAQKLEALGRLAGGIAHDFNNLLLPIITITEVTRDDFPPDSQQRSNLDKVVKAGQRGRALVDQILKFSRQQTARRRPVDLAEVVEDALGLARATTPSMIQVRDHIAGDMGKVLADPNQIHEVIMNLVSNATHAIGINTGVIEVSLCKASIDGTDGGPASLEAGIYARLTVSDSGSGMDEATLANIFDPFFTTRPIGEGTGLGLAAVHGIIAEHSGAITVSSRLGQETTVDVYLPLLETDAAKIVDAESDTRRVVGGQ